MGGVARVGLRRPSERWEQGYLRFFTVPIPSVCSDNRKVLSGPGSSAQPASLLPLFLELSLLEEGGQS